jgi:hypothetical protein
VYPPPPPPAHLGQITQPQCDHLQAHIQSHGNIDDQPSTPVGQNTLLEIRVPVGSSHGNTDYGPCSRRLIPKCFHPQPYTSSHGNTDYGPCSRRLIPSASIHSPTPHLTAIRTTAPVPIGSSPSASIPSPIPHLTNTDGLPGDRCPPLPVQITQPSAAVSSLTSHLIANTTTMKRNCAENRINFA